MRRSSRPAVPFRRPRRWRPPGARSGLVRRPGARRATRPRAPHAGTPPLPAAPAVARSPAPAVSRLSHRAPPSRRSPLPVALLLRPSLGAGFQPRGEGHGLGRSDAGFEGTYSGRSRPRIVRTAASNGYDVKVVFIGTTGPEINIERVRRRVTSGTGHDVPLPEITRRWSSGPEEPFRNGCVAQVHRRARQQSRHDKTRREHYEGRHQVAGDANARVGAGVDPTDRTTPPSHMTRTGAARRSGVRTELRAVCIRHL